MKLVFTFLILFFNSLKAWGQIYFIEKPDSSYFKKIQVAQFPEREKQRDGFVFFFTDTAYLNKNVRARIGYIIDSTSHNYNKERFKKRRIFFLNYRYAINSISYHTEPGRRNEVSDSSSTTIIADKYKRYWSWRSFKRKFRFLKTDTIYTAKVFSRSTLDLNATSTLKHLSNAGLGIIVSKDDKQIYKYVYENEQPYEHRYTYINFDDHSLKPLGISGRLNLEKPTIQILDFEGILFYFPIQKR